MSLRVIMVCTARALDESQCQIGGSSRRGACPLPRTTSRPGSGLARLTTPSSTRTQSCSFERTFSGNHAKASSRMNGVLEDAFAMCYFDTYLHEIVSGGLQRVQGVRTREERSPRDSGTASHGVPITISKARAKLDVYSKRQLTSGSFHACKSKIRRLPRLILSAGVTNNSLQSDRSAERGKLKGGKNTLFW